MICLLCNVWLGINPEKTREMDTEIPDAMVVVVGGPLYTAPMDA
jgi:hypothetical protein